MLPRALARRRFGGAVAAGCGESRPLHGAACFRPAPPQVKPGWHLPGRVIMCAAAMADSRQHADGRARSTQLFDGRAGPARAASASRVAGLYFDWSKTHLTDGLIADFDERAERLGFAGGARRLFAGEVVNPSEGRAAEHVAERGSGAPDDVELATARRQRMRRWSMRSRPARSATSPACSTSASAARRWGRRCWSTRSGGAVDARRALPVEYRRRRARRGVRGRSTRRRR